MNLLDEEINLNDAFYAKKLQSENYFDISFDVVFNLLFNI